MRAALEYGPGIRRLHELAAERRHLGRPPCYSTNPEAYHPTGEIERRDRLRARQLCAGCPIRRECLEYALANLDMSGIWGGTTDDERDEMRRMRSAS